jgi:hypothetical protein
MTFRRPCRCSTAGASHRHAKRRGAESRAPSGSQFWRSQVEISKAKSDESDATGSFFFSFMMVFFERKKSRKNRHFRHRDDQHNTRG